MSADCRIDPAVSPRTRSRAESNGSSEQRVEAICVRVVAHSCGVAKITYEYMSLTRNEA